MVPPSHMLIPTIQKSPSSSLIVARRSSQKPSLKVFKNTYLGESFGFNPDYEHMDSIECAPSSLNSKSTCRNDDGLNGNPRQLLNTLIESRQELKTDIEQSNAKLTKIDKKITEILNLMATGEMNLKSTSTLNKPNNNGNSINHKKSNTSHLK